MARGSRRRSRCSPASSIPRPGGSPSSASRPRGSGGRSPSASAPCSVSAASSTGTFAWLRPRPRGDPPTARQGRPHPLCEEPGVCVGADLGAVGPLPGARRVRPGARHRGRDSHGLRARRGGREARRFQLIDSVCPLFWYFSTNTPRDASCRSVLPEFIRAILEIIGKRWVRTAALIAPEPAATPCQARGSQTVERYWNCRIRS